MEANLVLCDWADAVNGKLFMMGAGWTSLPANVAVPVGLGVILTMSRDELPGMHSIAVRLLDADGAPALLGEPPIDVSQEGQFAAALPPDEPGQDEMRMNFALRWPALAFPKGKYRFVLQIDKQELASVTFFAMGGFGDETH